jgi:type II secretory pathway component PulK
MIFVSRHRPRTRKRQRGIALVAVLIAIAITLVISNEFGTSTSTDLMAAANYRDQVVAHFLARSSLNLAEIVIRLQSRIDNIKALRGQVQLTDYADQLITPFCGSPDEVEASIGFTPSQVKGLGADVGRCGFDGPIGTEDNKINVNCANVDASWQSVNAMLGALIYFPTYDYVFDDNAADGWHRDRQTQAAAIIDYIDSDTSNLRTRGTTEDYQYEALKDPYFAKNTYIDTTGELKLVRGVDDRFWTLFGSSLTVYGGCRTNLAALDNTQLIAAILYLSAKNPQDPVILDPKRLFLLASYVSKAKQFGETFLTLNDFITFVADPGAAVESIAKSDTGSMQGSAASSALVSGLPGLREQIGLVLDKGKLAQIATTSPRRTYHVRAWGEVTRKAVDKNGMPVFPPIRSTYDGIWDTKVVPQNVRKPPMPNGAWVFLKEE